MKLRVKEICNEKGITQKVLSERLGIAEISLSRSINGNPTIETLEKIATALEVPITELFVPTSNELYGLAVYNGQTYKLDNVEAVRNLLEIIED